MYGQSLLQAISARQTPDVYRQEHWQGSFAEYLDIVRQTPEGHAHRLPAGVRHDHVVRHLPGREDQGQLDPLQVLRRPAQRRRRRHLRPDRAADGTRQRLQERRPQVRHRAPRAAAARPGRQLEEHDRPAAEARPGTLQPDRRRRALHLRLEGRRRHDHLGPDARRAAAARSARSTATRSATQLNEGRDRARSITIEIDGDVCPLCRFILQASGSRSTTATGPKVLRGRRRQAAVPLRAGPHRHRHVPAQGREEPGLDRAHRRHQLPQDRRVRQRIAIRGRSTSTASSTSPTAA